MQSLEQVIEQASAIYSRVYAQAGVLFRAVAVWLALSFLGKALSAYFMPGDATITNTLGQSLAVFAGHVISAYAVLMGWYTAHRLLITGQMPASRVPYGLRRDKKAFEFVMAQIRNMLLLLGISLLVLVPLTFYFAFKYAEFATPEEAARIQGNISLFAIPVFIAFFSRLLLAAPLAARGELQAVSRSWRATRGHFVRINLLQLACLIPAAAGAIAPFVTAAGQPFGLQVFAGALATLGSFYSIVLFTQLAEDEYKKLLT